MPAQRAEVDAEAVVALGAAHEAVREQAALPVARVPPHRLARLGERRAHRRVRVDRVDRPRLGDQRAVVADDDVAVLDEADVERDAERRRHAQAHLGGPVDELADRAAGVAAVGGAGRPVEARVEAEAGGGDLEHAGPETARGVGLFPPRCASTTRSGPRPTSTRPPRASSASTGWRPPAAGATRAWAPTTASCRWAAATSSCWRSPTPTRPRLAAGAVSCDGTPSRAGWAGRWSWTTSTRSPSGSARR